MIYDEDPYSFAEERTEIKTFLSQRLSTPFCSCMYQRFTAGEVTRLEELDDSMVYSVEETIALETIALKRLFVIIKTRGK